MAAEDLPSEFDVVLVGTGLTESVVAAACARVGQRVLHLDTRTYYASKWASFTLNALLTWIDERQSPSDEVQDWSGLLQDGEEPICLSNADSASIRNVQVFCFARSAGDAEKAGPEPPRPLEAAGGKKMTFAHLLKEGRRFNIDLVSKLMYARGSLVDLLIKSNVSRYAEFKNVTRVLTYRHGNVEQVPCSRADVFASRRLSMVEKRKLMRFLASCVEEKEEEELEGELAEFLRDQQLGDNLQHFLLHSIAMVTEDTPTRDGLASTRHFLRCLGCYGNTPFLFPVYGLGEIPQCFCRMCAVFGGVYCLRHPVSCLLLDKTANRCTALIDGRGQRIASSHFVLEEGCFYVKTLPRLSSCRSISRGVLITNRSILPGDQHQVSVVTIPSLEVGLPAVRMVELSPSTMTCAPGTYLVHLTCQSQLGSAYEDLWPVVTRMFNTAQSCDQDSRPDVLWCFYFNMDDGGAGAESDGDRLPSNVYVCSGPDAELGHERAIKQAEAIFRKIVPDQDFCPPAPNPEDILYDADDPEDPANTMDKRDKDEEPAELQEQQLQVEE
uniref:Rab proteins geranylgeranyltransferase component A n=1 Tax=Hippocampus comes TaxID=109280 RepID=A0A3Q2XNU3_HIPCM